jgi:hypothetical protein
MDWSKLMERMDPAVVTQFVRAGRHVIQAMLYESERMRATQTPGEVDYNEAALARAAPERGWLTHDELRTGAMKLDEAVAAERWLDGMRLTLGLLRGLGGV